MGVEDECEFAFRHGLEATRRIDRAVKHRVTRGYSESTKDVGDC